MTNADNNAQSVRMSRGDGHLQSAGDRRTEIGIYLAAILMPGAIGVSSSIAVFMQHYGIDQVMALNVVSVPCFAIIAVTLVSGWLMSRMPKKTLNLIGIALFVAGGIAPAFVESWGAVIACRALFGLGLGIVQATTTALVAENYTGVRQDQVMGRSQSFQMLGLIIFSVIGGQLGAIAEGGYHAVFLVHLIGIASFVGVLLLVPRRAPRARASAPQQNASTGADAASDTKVDDPGTIHVTGGVILWFVVAIVFFMGGQVYSNTINVLMAEFGLGGTAEAGISLGVFAFGGFLAGFLFARVFKVARGFTLVLGLALLAVSYLAMTFSYSLAGIYAGSLLSGLSFSVCVPLIMSSIARAGINPASAAFAVSMATCGQSIGQSISPYIVTPAGTALAAVSGLTGNQGCLVVAIAICIVFALAFIPYGIRNSKR